MNTSIYTSSEGNQKIRKKILFALNVTATFSVGSLQQSQIKPGVIAYSIHIGIGTIAGFE